MKAKSHRRQRRSRKRISFLARTVPYGIKDSIVSGIKKIGSAIKPHLTISNALKVGKFAVQNRHTIAKATGLEKYVPFGQTQSENTHVPSYLLPMNKKLAQNEKKKRLYAKKNASKVLVQQYKKDIKKFKSKSNSFFNKGI